MRVKLFGGLEIKAPSGAEVRFAVRKSALVLAILVLAGPKGIRRERLSDLLWADRDQPRASLRQALVELRRLFATDGIPNLQITGDSEVKALSGPSNEADVWRFDELTKTKDLTALEEAADLYNGELLSGVELPDAVDDWVRPFKQEYAKKALRVAEYLSTLKEATSLIVCERLSERLLLVDPSAEEAHRALIRIFLRQGKTSAAARQLRQCSEALKQILGVEPERETVRLLESEAMPIPPSAMADNTIKPQLPDKPSVVVVPFENLSGTDDQYLVDGFVEEITATQSRIRDFFIIARQSAFASKDIFADVRQLGRELGVKYVVQGALRRSETNVRIAVRLVEAESRTLLWTERYEGSTADAFLLQDRIAEQVAGAMHPALMQAEIEAAKHRPPENLRAYDLLLQAYPKI